VGLASGAGKWGWQVVARALCVPRMNPIEVTAALLGLVNIGLIIRRSVWNYPFGIVMVVLYAHVFWGAKLYSDAGLQVFFLIVQFYGWVAWAQRQDDDGRVIVRRMGMRERIVWAVSSVVATGLWGTMMHRLTDAAYPYWDGSVAMLSVAAQIMMTRRAIENWWWWIAVDVLAIGLFAVKGLWLTAGLYGVFLALATYGLIEWQRKLAAA
jgi:nicotinamide mononucleotide transporter